MLEMLSGALVFGLVVSAFYWAIGAAVFKANLSILDDIPIYLRWIKKRGTLWENALQIAIIALAFSFLLSVLFLAVRYLGRNAVVVTSLAASWLALCATTRAVLRHLGVNKNYALVVGVLHASLMILLWLNYTTWLIPNYMALVMAAFFLIAFKNITISQTLVVGSAVVIHDLAAVFVTGMMIAVAQAAVPDSILYAENPAPIMIAVPKVYSGFAAPAKSAFSFIIGLGDVVFPGLIVVAVIRNSMRFGCRMMTVGALGGYLAGLLFTTAVLFIAKTGQPATIYLIPGVALGFLLTAAYYGKIKEVFDETKGPD